MPLTLVHPLQILAGAAISIALGSLWYSPLLFGKPWLAAMGATQAQIDEAKKKGMAKQFAGAFANSLVLMYVLNLLINVLGIITVSSGVVTGILLAIGFSATSQLGDVLWEGKKPILWGINVAYYLVLYSLAGAIFASWS